MMTKFLNHPDDVRWLLGTALRGVQGLPRFRSFVLIGNEDAPTAVDLYSKTNPTIDDPHWVVTLATEPPRLSHHITPPRRRRR